MDLTAKRVFLGMFGWLVLACVLPGCPKQGWIPEEGRYYGKCGVYAIEKPGSDWARVFISGNDLAFRHKKYNSIIQINSIGGNDYEDIPLRILTNHMMYGLKERKVEVQERRRVDGREALYTEITARLDGKPVKAAMMVLKKNRCIYDLSYITPPWNFGLAVGDYLSIVRAFRVGSL